MEICLRRDSLLKKNQFGLIIQQKPTFSLSAAAFPLKAARLLGVPKSFFGISVVP
jgi:hypothetical protein